MNDAAKAMILIADLLLEEDESVAITGVELVLDAGSMTFQHAAQLNPNTIKKATVVMQVCVFLWRRERERDSIKSVSVGERQAERD